MRTRTAVVLSIAGASLAVGGWLGRSRADAPRHAVPASRDGNLVVTLCDGETSAEVPGVRPGERLPRDRAQALSDGLMAEWRRKNPEARWDVAQALPVPQQPQTGAQPGGPAADQSQHGGGGPPQPGSAPPGQAQPGAAVQPGGKGAAEAPPDAAKRIEAPGTPGEKAAQGQTPAGAGGKPAAAQGPVQEGHTYGAFSERDLRIWQAETDKFVAEGNRIFHSAELVGGTIGVSCDMCHPDAANTHPETYPKFQVQFGRVALLRDMINWCIENPTRGKPLPDDDVRLRALEAYILAQRKGVPLEYGKH